MNLLPGEDVPRIVVDVEPAGSCMDDAPMLHSMASVLGHLQPFHISGP